MKENLNNWIKDKKATWLIGVFFSVFLYSTFIFQMLTNTFDGMWQQDYYFVGGWGITTGRWFWPYLDLFISKLHIDPINSIIALAIFSFGYTLVISVIKPDKLSSALSVLTFFSSVTVSVSLSYRHMSLDYSFSFLFACLAIYFLIKLRNKYMQIILSAVCIALSMGAYQAYLSCFCVFAIVYLLKKLYENPKEIKESLSYCLKIMVSLLSGGVIYFLITKAHLFVTNRLLSNYGGADSISIVKIILGLPKNILLCYKSFFGFFFSGEHILNVWQRYYANYIFFAILCLLLIATLIKVFKKSLFAGIIVAIAILLIPIACNVFFLFGVNSGLQLQMAVGIATLIPALTLLFFCGEKNKLIKIVTFVFAILIIFSQSSQVVYDQTAMYQGRNATVNVIQNSINRVNNMGLLSDKYEYYFIGTPSKNEMFSTRIDYKYANTYAQYGNFWLDGSCNYQSYIGLVNRYMGTNMKIAKINYNCLSEYVDVDKMAAFPSDKSVIKKNDTVFIMISPLEKQYRTK